MKLREIKQVSAGDFLTTEEAATFLGIKPSVIRNYLSAGKLTTYKFKTLTLLKAEEVAEWRSRQRGR